MAHWREIAAQRDKELADATSAAEGEAVTADANVA
jgi:hypothetical protein